MVHTRWTALLIAVVVLLPVIPPTPAFATAGGAAAPKVVDGRIDDWVGTRPGVGGRWAMSAGELVHQDHIYDDAGAAVVRDGTANQDTDAKYRGNFPPAGTFSYPADAQRYGSNAADLLELRLALDGDQVVVMVKLTTLLQADTTVVGIAFGDDAGDRHDWPLGAGLSTPGSRHVLTLWGTGGAWDDQPLADVGGQVAVDVEANAIEASVPAALVGTAFRVYAATGLWDGDAGRWMAVDRQQRTADRPGGGNGTTPNVFNVAFRTDEAEVALGRPRPFPGLMTWWEYGQAEALARGDISHYHADVDLLAPDTLAQEVRGWQQRIHRSSVTVGRGEGIDEIGVTGEGSNTPQDSGAIHYLGPWQPYNLYVPQQYDRATLLLHGAGQLAFALQPGVFRDLGEARGSILVDPLGRGVKNWWKDEGELAALEALADAMAHHPVDPTLTTVAGLSMGGYGTARLLATRPDLFAAGIVVSGCFGEPPICNAGDAPLEVLENLRNVGILLNHGVTDEIATYYRPLLAAQRLDELGYAHQVWSHPTWQHNTVQVVDDWSREAQWLDGFRLAHDPPRVTYTTSEAWWSPQVSPLLVYDHAYWVSGLRVRDTSQGYDSRGTVDATTHGRGGRQLVTHRFVDARPEGPPAPHVRSGRQIDPAAPPIEPGNRFTAELANLSTVTFDLPRMGLTTTQPLEAILTTDGPAEVRLGGAGPVLAEGAEIRQTGADAVIVLPEAGTYTVTLVADPDGGGGDGEEPPDPGEEPDPEEGTPGTWFLHRDDIDCQTRQTSLRPTPGSGEALCYEPLQPVNEVFVRTGAQPPLRLSFPTVGGTPVVVDADRPARVQLVISNMFLLAGAGAARLEVALTGHASGQPVAVGSASRDYLAQPLGDTVVDLELPVDDALHGIRLDDLRMDVLIGGVTAAHGVLVMDGRSRLDLPVTNPTA